MGDSRMISIEVCRYRNESIRDWNFRELLGNGTNRDWRATMMVEWLSYTWNLMHDVFDGIFRLDVYHNANDEEFDGWVRSMVKNRFHLD